MKRSIHPLLSSRKAIIFASLLVFLVASFILVIITQQQQNIRSRASHELNGTVNITGVAVNNSSVKVSFLPVTGAVDYRIYDVNNPALMKYAGKVYLQDGTSSPEQIEWNLLGDGQEHTVVVEAVNALGPVPRANQYDVNNRPLINPLPDNAMTGANAGPTTDGNFSINGQGPSTNNPHVIARSQQLVVSANSGLRAIPSGQDATQTFFDTFPNASAASIQRAGEIDTVNSAVTYRMGTAPADWTILFSGVDTANSMPFIADDHFMEMVFDGGNPLHTAFGYMTMLPRPQLDFSNGRIAHLTMEVDSHFNDNRWVGIELAPATDPFRSLNPAQLVNNTNRGIFVEILDTCVVDFANGISPNGSPIRTRLIGDSVTPCNRRQNGIGLDNRTRFDLFISQNRIAIFENGVLLSQAPIPQGLLNFQQAQAYFSHYQTESSQGRQVLQQSAPYMDYWINQFPYSDERHWDNMGFEVLPAATAGDDWGVLGARIQMPRNVPLPTVSASPQPTRISTPTLAPTGRPTVRPTILPTIFPPLSITPLLSPTPQAGNGLQGTYIIKPRKGQNPILSRIDSVIDFRPGQHNHQGGSTLPENTTVVRWNGYIVPKESGEYTLIVKSNGITRLLIDNRPVISQDKLTPQIFGELPYTKNIERWILRGISEEIKGKLNLTSGRKYPLFLDYVKKAKEGSITLLWITPSGTQQVIPKENLFPK